MGGPFLCGPNFWGPETCGPIDGGPKMQGPISGGPSFTGPQFCTTLDVLFEMMRWVSKILFLKDFINRNSFND
ncbi:hypothetical protein A9Q84_00055 [Halobacteriovorax marinus]|uniref:Uncharacterized protein n=1 Tax=Halobacteriovorax marinus TaxID=97084 RepID=A0A1Y5FD02_9BACT|nr:hypothetical protein A9Q84_00055 [Halobacteriovorax marinus]